MKSNSIYIVEFRMRNRARARWRPALGMFAAWSRKGSAVDDARSRGMHDNVEYRVVRYVGSKAP